MFLPMPNTTRNAGSDDKSRIILVTVSFGNGSGATPITYAELLSSASPAVIRNEAENERSIRLLEELDGKSNRATTAERRMAELLTLLIEAFEERRYALKRATPIEALTELMDANGLKQKDLLDIFGTPSIVSEVLKGKRNLTVSHIRELSQRFDVSPELFI